MPHAVIAGAGVAGLAAAWWLRQSGWRTTIIERADAVRAGGYVMGLSGPGYQVIAQMGLLPAVAGASLSPGRTQYRDRRDRVLMTIDHGAHMAGLDYLVVRRGDLVRIIADALEAAAGPPTTLLLANSVQAVTQLDDGVRVDLADGRCERADLLLIADGVHSATRRLVWPAGPEPLVPMGYRFAAYDVAATTDLGGDFLGYVAPGYSVEYYRLREGRMAALHVWATDCRRQPGDAAELAELLQMHAADPPLVRETLQAAQVQGVRPVIDDLLMVDMAPWHRGRCVLLGDAAHCITLISGQGAGIALAGAATLAQALGSAASIEAGLIAYSARMRPAISRLQQRSRSIARWFVPRNALACAVRNTIVRAMPRPLLTRYFRNSLKAEIDLFAALSAPG